MGAVLGEGTVMSYR